MQKFDADLSLSRVKEHTQTRLDEKTLAGMTAAVWVHGEKQYQAVMGWADPISGRPMTGDAVFRLASMTKPVTGCATMMQAEKGLIGLDDPVTRWIPEFAGLQVAVATPEGDILQTRKPDAPITPRMLLTHSSGIVTGPTGDKQFAAIPPERRATLADAMHEYAQTALNFQPGTTQLYSPIAGMDVLARLVEITADMPYTEFLKKYVFDPLEMPDTGYLPNAEQAARTVAMVEADGKYTAHPYRPQCGFIGFPDGYPGGGAGLFSTLEDYSHLALMYLNNGEYKGCRLLKKETVDAMATPQLPEDFWGITRNFNWGLSMRVCPVQTAPQQPLSAGTFGWSGAYGTHFWVDRATDSVGVYMSNLTNGGGAGAPTAFEFERDVMAGFGINC